MKFNPMLRDLPQDIRPIGTNNLNQLVHHHLGSQSFDVVAQVQANLPWLHELHHKLGIITKLAHHGHTLDEIGRHSQTLYAIAQSMPALREIYANLNMLTFSGITLKELNQNQKDILEELEALHGQVSQAAIQDLLNRYSALELKLAENEAIVDGITQLQEDNQVLNKVLLHLMASDAITLAQETKEESDINSAKLAVDKSIKAGNDETINTERLEKLDE